MIPPPLQMIYFDNNSTTPLAPEVVAAMRPYLEKQYANPSSGHSLGRRVRQAVETARAQIAKLLNCNPSSLFFTSCGTESNNTALLSALHATGRRRIITSAVEHSSIKNHLQHLEKLGYSITRLNPSSDGTLEVSQVEAALSEKTALVSFMWANHETGVVFPIEEIAQACRKHGALFHTDAVQVCGKTPIGLLSKGVDDEVIFRQQQRTSPEDSGLLEGPSASCNTKSAHQTQSPKKSTDLQNAPIDFLSLSGHKFHAPKGVGVLFARDPSLVAPLIFGGNQEQGKRGGTENVASIIGLGVAAELALANMEENQRLTRTLRDSFEKGILQSIPDCHINGHLGKRLGHVTNISFENLPSETLLLALDQRGLCASAASACTTGSLAPSYVLRAMGLSVERSLCSLRFSFSPYNTQQEAEEVLSWLPALVQKLRRELPASK